MAPATSSSKSVIVVGGGIIGASVAYYLTQHSSPASVSVVRHLVCFMQRKALCSHQPLLPCQLEQVERDQPACAASGKAGGFLALDWNDGSQLEPLARLSYHLHAQLATTLGADKIGYRQVDTVQVLAMAQPASHGGPGPAKLQAPLPAWVDSKAIVAAAPAGDTSTTAQVHPRLLTNALLDSAKAQGAQLIKGTAQGLVRGTDGRVKGVVVDGEELLGNAVVLAMGPWTPQAQAWIPGADLGRIAGLKYHSVVLQPSEPVTALCLEARVVEAGGRQLETEVYPRPDGTVYVCGQPQELPVPASASGVTVEPELARRVQAAASVLSSCLGEGQAQLLEQQACYLPISQRPGNLPVIGEVPGEPGLYVAAGHSCWGILNGPATGKVIAELILDGKVSCLPGGLGPLQPKK